MRSASLNGIFLLAVSLAAPAAFAGNLAAPAATVTPIYIGTTNMLGMINTARQSTEDATRRGLIGDGAQDTSAAQSTDFRFGNDANVSAQARRAFLASVTQSSGQAVADSADRLFGDVRTTFARMAGPYGLRIDDFADVMTAYTAVVWMAANKRVDLPTVPQVQGLRQQMRGMLAGKLGDATQRQLLGETMMYQTCMLVSLREQAQAQGHPEVFDMIAEQVDKGSGQGGQLRQMALTDQGLVRR